MKHSFIILFVAILQNFTIAQSGSLTVKVDKDTMYQDEVIKVEFLLDNLTGNFKAPDFIGFRVVSGPNTSSSFSMINGEVSQKKSYTYLLMPQTKGHQVIGEAYVQNDTGMITSDAVDIYVLDTDNLKSRNKSKQRSFIFESEGQAHSKEKSNPKRVLKKI
jgi:acetate kinase